MAVVVVGAAVVVVGAGVVVVGTGVVVVGAAVVVVGASVVVVGAAVVVVGAGVDVVGAMVVVVGLGVVVVGAIVVVVVTSGSKNSTFSRSPPKFEILPRNDGVTLGPISFPSHVIGNTATTLVPDGPDPVEIVAPVLSRSLQFCVKP